MVALNSTDSLHKSPKEKPWVVLKFGGTSIGKFLDNIADKIIRDSTKENHVAVVCSARSGDIKLNGTTSRLLRACDEVLLNQNKHTITVAQILEDHIQASRQYIKNQDMLNNLESQLREDCKKLEHFLDALFVIKEISPRSKDVIIGTGEKLSCRVVSAYLNYLGLHSELVDLSDVVNESFSHSKHLEQPFYDHLSQQFSNTVGLCKDTIPVITGFFGAVPGSLLTSIGRGYTDLAAALVAVGLGAIELQIWKEVDGIFTADPRKVKNARLLPIISPEEAAELTYYGSEVIHPFTMEQVMRARIPIRIKNVQNPQGEGSIILPNNENDEPPAELFLLNGYDAALTRRHPTAVTIKEDVLILNVHSNKKSVSHSFFANLFTILDSHGIIVDLISTSEVHVSLAISHVDSLNPVVQELSRYGDVHVQDEVCILSLVGKQMRNMVGIAAQMFSTLAEAGINIEMISQGSSEINISCVIPQDQGLIALNAIHKNLLEY